MKDIFCIILFKPRISVLYRFGLQFVDPPALAVHQLRLEFMKKSIINPNFSTDTQIVWIEIYAKISVLYKYYVTWTTVVYSGSQIKQPYVNRNYKFH